MNPTTQGWTCQVTHDTRHQRNGKAYCSQACADLHPRVKRAPVPIAIASRM